MKIEYILEHSFFVWCACYVTCVQRNARFRMTPKIYDAESVSLDEALGIDTVWDRAGDTRLTSPVVTSQVDR